MKRTLIALSIIALATASIAGRVTWQSYSIGQLNGAAAETIDLKDFLRGATSFHVVATVDTFKADVTSIVPTLQLSFPTASIDGTDTVDAVQWTPLTFSQAAFGGGDSWYFTGATNAFGGRNVYDTLAALATWPRVYNQHIESRFIFKNRTAADTTKSARLTIYRYDE